MMMNETIQVLGQKVKIDEEIMNVLTKAQINNLLYVFKEIDDISALMLTPLQINQIELIVYWKHGWIDPYHQEKQDLKKLIEATKGKLRRICGASRNTEDKYAIKRIYGIYGKYVDILLGNNEYLCI